MFKVNNKDTRTTLSSVSVVNFEHVIAGWKRNHIRVLRTITGATQKMQFFIYRFL